MVSWAVESERSNTTNRDDFNTLVVSVKLFAVEEPLQKLLKTVISINKIPGSEVEPNR